MERITNQSLKALAAMLIAAAFACVVLAAYPLNAYADGAPGFTPGCDTPGGTDVGSQTADKPTIVSIEYGRSYGSSASQPAAGGTYVWLITFSEGSDLSKIVDEDFTIQRKPWKKEWKNSKCPVPFFEKLTSNTGKFTAMGIPDNKAGQNLWRFLYLGQDLKCPIIIQHAYEGKTALLNAIELAEKDLTGTVVSADGSDLAEGTEYVTQQTADAFQKAIDEAQAVCDDESITQDTTDAAVEALNEAKDAFDAAKKTAGAPSDPGSNDPIVDSGQDDPITDPGKDDPITDAGKDDPITDSSKDDPTKQMGSDGSALGAGASAAAADAAILSSASKEGPVGSKFGKVQLRSTKQAKNSITLAWAKVKGAKSYVVYAGPEGKKGMKKAKTLAKTSLVLKKIAGKRLASGTYYRAMVVALDAQGNVISSSKIAHVSTKGGKAGNPSKVTTKAKKGKVALKKGASFKLAAKQKIAKGVKVAKHRAIKYETSNAKIATVSAKGAILAKNKGTCYVYAYAQNGVFAKVKVTVKASSLKTAAMALTIDAAA